MPESPTPERAASESPIPERVRRRLFIVGVPRSGTTLLQSLLAAHGSMTSFTESHFFDHHFKRLPLLGLPVLTRDPRPRLRDFLIENGEVPPPAADRLVERIGAFSGRRLRLPRHTRPVARELIEVLDELALRRGSTGWIEKTPRHLRYLPFLENWASGARTDFVHLVRDGLETVASLHKASQRWERPYDVSECVRRWNTDVGLSHGRLGAPKDHFVLYEELTTEPEAALRRLLADLDLEWRPEILADYGQASSRLVTEEESWKADVGRGIRPSRTSEQVLTERQREWARKRLHRHLYEEIRDRRDQRAARGERR